MDNKNGTTWVTFYSYKGGVGRTLSLVNTADILVNNDRRVVLIDFDLEAPGLDSYDFLGVPSGQKGVVEYFSEHLATGQAPDIKEYTCRPVSRTTKGRRPLLTTKGELRVIPAGRKDDPYNRALGELDFHKLFQDGIGQDMVEEFKAAIEEEFSPDYVFVDSRTGLTDVGGVCTFVLPDIVALVYGLNRQNVEGVGRIQNAIRKHALEKRDPIELVRIISPFPAAGSHDEELGQRLEEVSKSLGEEDVRVPYRPEFSYKEEPLNVFRGPFPYSRGLHSLHSLDSARLLHRKKNMTMSARGRSFPSEQMSIQAFHTIALSIIARAPRGVDLQLRDLHRLKENPEESGPQSFQEQVAAFAAQCDRPSVLTDLADLVRDDLNCQDLYVEIIERSFHLNPLDHESFEDLRRIYLRRNNRGKLVELLKLSFESAKTLQQSGQPLRGVPLIDELGHLSMTLGDYESAVEAFQWTFDVETADEAENEEANRSEVSALATRFNLLEAKRRADKEVASEEISDLVGRFGECFPETARSNTADFANKLQSISIPLALTGKVEVAITDLCEARAISDIMPDDKAFSVKSYQDEIPAVFAQHCEEMAQALSTGRLWDGTPVPNAPGRDPLPDDEQQKATGQD